MSDIFISYADEDRQRAQILARALEELGWTVWWDRVIPAGKNFPQAIEEALADARCIIVLWSHASIKSEWVREEADAGRERSILIPILIDQVNPPLGFRSIQAAPLADWKGGTSEPSFKKVVQDISVVAGKPPEPRTGAVLNQYIAQMLEEVSSWHGVACDKRVSLREHYVPHMVSMGGAESGDLDESVILHDMRQRAGAAIVEGPAGCGKTTLLRSWTAHLIERSGSQEASECVPLLVPLVRVADLCTQRNDWSIGPGAVSAALHAGDSTSARADLQEILDDAVGSGQAVLLYDAFDEVPIEHQRRICTWLDLARRAARGCPIVVASRPCQLMQGFDQFDVYYLRPFNVSQCRTFVRRWFETVRGAGNAEPGVAALMTEPIMRDERVAGSPLFLTMVCDLFEGHGQLPHSSAGLLRRFTRLLLQAARHARFSVAEKTKVLEALSSSMVEGQVRRLGEHRAIEIAKGVLSEIIARENAESVLAEAVDSGLLEIDALGFCEFRHHLLVDFFAASEVLSRCGADGAGRWIGEHDFDEDRRLDQVILFLQELIGEEQR